MHCDPQRLTNTVYGVEAVEFKTRTVQVIIPLRLEYQLIHVTALPFYS